MDYRSELQPDDPASLEALFISAQTSQPGASMWFEHEDGAMLGVHINGERSCLVYFYDGGDSGTISYDPSYTGPEDAVLPYALENGQVDEYPVRWTIPIRDALNATLYFLRTGQPAPWINWGDEW